MILDGQVFRHAHKTERKNCFASSDAFILLQPKWVTKKFSYEYGKTSYEADDLWWAKLMAELTLKAYHQQYGLQTASCRYFTVII